MNTPVPSAEPKWLTVTQAATRLGCSRRTIYAFIDTGALTRYRLGTRAVRLDAAEVDRLITADPTDQA